MNIGVDFGTAYTQVSYIHNGVVEVIKKSGLYGIDSLFYYDAERAQEQREKYERAIRKKILENAQSNKIEKTEEEINKETSELINKLEKWCFGVVGSPANSYASQIGNAQNLVSNVKLHIGETFELDGETFTSEEVIKAIYKEVIFNFAQNIMKKNLPESNIDGVVLTHPAEFEIDKINEIVKAAQYCDDSGKPLRIIGTIKEPVAAALSYYEKTNHPDGTGILVYDLGSGTCDVAIVRKQKDLDQEYEVIDFGTIEVGGLDWDYIVFNYIISEIKNRKPNGEDIINNEDNIFEFTKQAREIKEQLSAYAVVNKRISFRDSGDYIDVTLTRSMFDELSQTIRNQTINLLEKLYLSHYKEVNISEIILVGGASNMPQIKEDIERRFEDKNIEVKLSNPEYATCIGASIYADKVMEKLKEKYTDKEIDEKFEESVSGDNSTSGNLAVLLYEDGKSKGVVTDAIPFSYGVMYHFSGKPYVKNLITRGQHFPVVGYYDEFKPEIDNATTVYIEIYESNNSEMSYCYNGERLVGFVNLEIPEGVNRKDKIKCELKILSLDAVEVTAECKGKNVVGRFELIKPNQQN